MKTRQIGRLRRWWRRLKERLRQFGARPQGPHGATGIITYSDQWRLTPRRRFALERLAELGVNVAPSVGGGDYTLTVPHGLPPARYVEVGYLIAQLGDEFFPEECEPISDVPSQVYPGREHRLPPVVFVGEQGQGLVFRVYPIEERH